MREYQNHGGLFELLKKIVFRLSVRMNEYYFAYLQADCLYGMSASLWVSIFNRHEISFFTNKHLQMQKSI